MNAHRSGLRTNLKLVVHTYGKNKRKVIIKNAGASLIYSKITVTIIIVIM